LEFNVPFQHKYGYIRDDTVTSTTYITSMLQFLYEVQQTD